MSTYSSRENNWGRLLALGIALGAGGQWLAGLCYSRGYDFFLWLYNAWLMAGGGGGAWPNWSAHSAAGHPAFKMAGVVDAVCFAPFVELFGVEAGAQVYAVALYALAGLGMYALGRDLTQSVLGGVVASAAYALSWFITFTAYYQSYLSNFLSYALMPWCALYFIRALTERSRGALLVAAAMLFISIASNAQVAVKVVLFVVPLAYLVHANAGGGWRPWIVQSAVLCGLAGCCALFLIAPALMMRQEVLLLGEARGNAFIAPWLVLFWIPLFGVNYVWYMLSGAGFLGRDFLAWAVFSDYVGLSVLAIALCSWGLYRATGERLVKGLWFLAGGYFLVYFAVVPNLAASAWIGRTHNWAILPTLALALLAGFGARYIAQRVAPRWKASWSGVALVALIAADLGGVSYFLNRLAITHSTLDDLPEVGVWRDLRAGDEAWEQGSRYFTYNPDHTFYLLPVLEQKPVANIIELRSRTWEYDSYVAHQLAALRALDPTYNASESLALLDVEYVDLARKLYDYRGDANAFERGFDHLRQDPGLELLVAREQQHADLSYDAYRSDLALGHIVDAGASAAILSQVVFRNSRHRWGFVPEKAVLVVGPTRLGQDFFEKVTHLPAYRADRLLFVLSETVEEIHPRALEAFAAQVVVGEVAGDLPRWEMADVRAFYARPIEEKSRLARVSHNAERGEYALDRNGAGAFMLIAQQRFADWHAYGGGVELPVFKAQAGLSAVFVPADITRIEYRYELPAYEKAARWISLLGFALSLMWWIAGRPGRKSAAAAPPQYAEREKDGSNARHGKTAGLVGR